MNTYDLEYLESYLSSLLFISQRISEATKVIESDGIWMKIGSQFEERFLAESLQKLTGGEKFVESEVPQLAKLVTLKYLEFQKLKIENELAELGKNLSLGKSVY